MKNKREYRDSWERERIYEGGNDFPFNLNNGSYMRLKIGLSF